MPLCQELAQIIINDRAFYDLPRKFNIAYDGGGLIGTVEDTNDIGAKQSRSETRSSSGSLWAAPPGTRLSPATSACWCPRAS